MLNSFFFLKVSPTLLNVKNYKDFLREFIYFNNDKNWVGMQTVNEFYNYEHKRSTCKKLKWRNLIIYDKLY